MDTKRNRYYNADKKKRSEKISTNKKSSRYDENFKRTVVNLYQTGNKTQAALCREYGIAPMTLSRWIKQYSILETDDGESLTVKQVKEFQKCNAQFEEKVLILEKRLPYSLHTQTKIRSST